MKRRWSIESPGLESGVLRQASTGLIGPTYSPPSDTGDGFSSPLFSFLLWLFFFSSHLSPGISTVWTIGVPSPENKFQAPGFRSGLAATIFLGHPWIRWGLVGPLGLWAQPRRISAVWPGTALQGRTIFSVILHWRRIRSMGLIFLIFIFIIASQ